MKLKRTYSDKDFIRAVKTSLSVRQVLIKLKLRPLGGNYRTYHTMLNRLKLDDSHFTGQLWNKGKVIGPKRPIHDYLSNSRAISSDKLKKRLLRECIFEYKCHHCGLAKWNEQPIPLELEHKDGNHLNNNLDNLSLLCPNCHALTPTYRGKNMGKCAYKA